MKSPSPGACLLAGLLLILAPIKTAAQGDADAASTLAVKQMPTGKTRLAQTADLDKIGKRARAEHKSVDIFKGKSWYVAPPKPKPKPPPTPPPPTAPPIPYAYMGSYRGEDGRMVIFLTRGDHVFSVSPGDVLEGIYRVEEIASGQLVLLYLPLSIRQTMNIGETS